MIIFPYIPRKELDDERYTYEVADPYYPRMVEKAVTRPRGQNMNFVL
jgi:hypothetical protein